MPTQISQDPCIDASVSSNAISTPYTPFVLGSLKSAKLSSLHHFLRLISQEKFDDKRDSSLSDREYQSDENKSSAVVLSHPSYGTPGFYWPHANFATALYFAHAKNWAESLKNTPYDSDSSGASSSYETHSDVVETTSKENHESSDSNTTYDEDYSELSLVERIVYLGEKIDIGLHDK